MHHSLAFLRPTFQIFNKLFYFTFSITVLFHSGYSNYISNDVTQRNETLFMTETHRLQGKQSSNSRVNCIFGKFSVSTTTSACTFLSCWMSLDTAAVRIIHNNTSLAMPWSTRTRTYLNNTRKSSGVFWRFLLFRYNSRVQTHRGCSSRNFPTEGKSNVKRRMEGEG